MRIEASAPTRIDLAGGTLDIWPLYLHHRDAQTINVAISLRASCALETRPDDRCVLTSEDTGRSVEATRLADLPDEPEFRLLRHALDFFRVEGVELRTRSDSPLGAGIAGSSALAVALCGALNRWTKAEHSPEALLTIAMNLEAQTIRVPTGVQDYRPALYGGVSAVELGVDGVRRVRLDVDGTELARRLVLAYTGASRNSGVNNWEITRRHIEGDTDVHRHFERIRDVAVRLRAALVAGDWPEVGHQLADEWECRKQLAPSVTTLEIDRLIAAAGTAGALGGKVCGAGGGGCLACFAQPGRVEAVREALERAGATILDYRVDTDGLRVTTSPHPLGGEDESGNV